MVISRSLLPVLFCLYICHQVLPPQSRDLWEHLVDRRHSVLQKFLFLGNEIRANGLLLQQLVDILEGSLCRFDRTIHLLIHTLLSLNQMSLYAQSLDFLLCPNKYMHSYELAILYDPQAD